MSILNELQLAANEDAVSAHDMTVATKGGGGVLYPEGYCFARLVEVVELGSHRQEYQGVLKDPSPMFRLGFAIWGEGYQNEDGTPGIMRTYEISLSSNEKAKAFKLFKKLNYKGVAKTFAQLLNSVFLLKVLHYTSKTAGSKPRSIIDLEGFLPANDPVTKQPYAIPEAPESLFKLFLWSKPTKPMWDSLFVEGAFDDGKTKNFIQEQIQSATDFPGSAIEALLHGVGAGAIPTLAVPAMPVPEVGAEPVAAPVETAPVLAVPSTPVVPAVPSAVPTAPTAPAIPAIPTAPSMPAMPVMPKL